MIFGLYTKSSLLPQILLPSTKTEGSSSLYNHFVDVELETGFHAQNQVNRKQFCI